MSLAATGRRDKRPNKAVFNELVGIQALAEMAIASQKSKTREAGSEFWRPLSLDGNTWEDLFVEKVFPTLRKLFEPTKQTVVVEMNWAKL